MGCASCRATFAGLEAEDLPDSRARLIDRAHPNCSCQLHSVSPFSSGIVTADEALLRILIVPFHVDRKKNVIKEGAITAAEVSGLSMFREGQATDEEIRETAEQLVHNARSKNNPRAGVYGVLRVTCRSLREFQHPEELSPCYCVYDTSLQFTPSHAEAFQRVFDVDEPMILDRRRKLTNKLKESRIIPVANFRDGLLSHLAMPS